MCLKMTGSVISFFGALVVGVAAAWLVNPWSVGASLEPFRDPGSSEATIQGPMFSGDSSCHRAQRVVSVSAEGLRGRWRGYWGHDDPSVMDIDRIDGNRFYGSLRDDVAEIRIEGTVDTNSRQVTIRETKVIRQDHDVDWSLGNDIGTFSPDGRSLNGSGTDKWQTYSWEMEKESK